MRSFFCHPGGRRDPDVAISGHAKSLGPDFRRDDEGEGEGLSGCVLSAGDFPGGGEFLLELGKEIGVGRYDVAGLQGAGIAIAIAGEAAGFAHQQDSRRQVPGFQVAFPESIKAARRNIAKLEGDRAKPADADGLGLNQGDLSPVICLAIAAAVGNAAADQCFMNVGAVGNAQALVVEEAPAPFSAVKSSSLIGL